MHSVTISTRIRVDYVRGILNWHLIDGNADDTEVKEKVKFEKILCEIEKETFCIASKSIDPSIELAQIIKIVIDVCFAVHFRCIFRDHAGRPMNGKSFMAN